MITGLEVENSTGWRWLLGRKGLANAHPKAKKIAFLRLAILWACSSERCNSSGIKTRAMEEFIKTYNSGAFLPAEYERIAHISRASLYNWKKAYKDYGISGLVPRYKFKEQPGSTPRVRFKPIPACTKIIIPGIPRCRRKHIFLSQLRKHWQAPLTDRPIGLSIFFYMPIPKGTKMKRRMRMLKHRISHTGNPDLGALNSFTLDCMVGVIFKDYSQIVRFHSEKEYRWIPETQILIRVL